MRNKGLYRFNKMFNDKKRLAVAELKIVFNNYFTSNRFLERNSRGIASKLAHRDYFFLRINVCHFSGNSRANIDYFGVSRHILKYYATHLKLPGVRKANW